MRHMCGLYAAIVFCAVIVIHPAWAGEEEPLPDFNGTWHSLAGKSLHVYADTEALFVCDFEQGVSSSSGPAVEPEVQEGVKFVKGPFGKAVKATRLAYPGKALLDPEEMYFGFWIRLDFDPATDTKNRVIMQMGDGTRNSLVMRTDGAGMLMLILSDDDYASACRKDISRWKQGEWHHVAGWYRTPGKGGGRMWLLTDGYGADSTTMYHNDGLTAEDLTTLYLGGGPDGKPSCAVDEVLFTRRKASYVAYAHHGWMLGIAQLAADGKLAAEIKPSPWGVAANPKAVVGTVRVFGLEAWVPRMPRITSKGITSDKDPASAAPEWTMFNLQTHPGAWYGYPFGIGKRIAWSSSDPEIAEVVLEENARTKTMQPPKKSGGGQFKIKKVGTCKIMATMGGRTWTYPLAVMDRDRPDLLVQFISRLPRYDHKGVKDRPAAGDPVEFEVHVANRGFKTSEPAKVTLRVYESGGPTDLDARRAKVFELTKDLKALEIHEQTALQFPWTWRTEPHHVVATIETRQRELSTHNNVRSYLTANSRNIYLLVDPDNWQGWLEANNSHVGSFSLEDWLHAQAECWDRLLRESVYPATSPHGIQVRLHIDKLIEMWENPNDWGKNKPGPYWDGGWICGKGWAHPQAAGRVGYSLMHEWGHGAFAGADLYSYSVWDPWFYVRDEQGNKIIGTGALPTEKENPKAKTTLIYTSSAHKPSGTNGRHLAETMMNRCSPQLHEGFAGHIHRNRLLRAMNIWQVHRRGIPLIRNTLVVRDIEGRPVEGAEIAVWQQSHGVEANSGRSFWPNIIKFAGRTDEEGKWIYPYETAVSYDDPDTDRVERRIEVATPLSSAKSPWPASPGVWSNNSMQLIGVRKGPWTEYHFLDEAEFWIQAYRNDRVIGTYVIQTNLSADLGTVETKPWNVEPAPDPNERPVVVVEEVVKCEPGAEVAIDASGSHDPEGNAVVVHWILGGWRAEWDIRKLGGKMTSSDQGPVLEFTAPDKPCTIKVKVYCHDTTRVSKTKEVTIIIGGGQQTEDGKAGS